MYLIYFLYFIGLEGADLSTLPKPDIDEEDRKQMTPDANLEYVQKCLVQLEISIKRRYLKLKGKKSMRFVSFKLYSSLYLTFKLFIHEASTIS